MKKTLVIYAYWESCTYGIDGGHFVFLDSDILKDSKGYKLLGSKEVEFDLGEFNAREALIETLQKERQVIREEAAQKVAVIEDRLQQLLALPNIAEEPAEQEFQF